MFTVFHQPYQPFAYATTPTTARVVCCTELNQVASALVHFGDRYTASFSDVLPLIHGGTDGLYDYFYADVEIATHRLKYVFELNPNQNPTWFGEKGHVKERESAGVFQLAYLSPRDIHEAPDWINGAVCYQIFPERFANGNPRLSPSGVMPWASEPLPNNYLGGDLKGIFNSLDYLSALGVSLVYLTPIFQANSNHKYDTEDYFKIDRQFGSKSDFKKFVDAAHDRGIRVMLDAVFNHSGGQFAPFLDVQEKGRDSVFWDWFFIEGETVDTKNVNYETFANGVASMPKLNYANPAVEKYFLKVGAYWVREFGIDGWRLDVANEVDHVFWKKFRDTIRKINPDALIVGEVWHNALPWVHGDEFDSVMNYLFREACLEFFIRNTIDAQQFAETTTRLLFLYPEMVTRGMFNLLGSHDTERILTLAKDDVSGAILAMVFQFVYPGIPMIYYGDELGMTGGADPNCRKGMVWEEANQNLDMLRAVTELAYLKRHEAALQTTRLTYTTCTEGVIGMTRRSFNDKETLYVVINTSYAPAAVNPIGELVFASEATAVSHQELAPRSAAIWKVCDLT